MINLSHIIKFLGLITLGSLLSSQYFEDKKFEKDLKKISIGNEFIDNLGNIYPIENISDKKNTILIYSNEDSIINKIKLSAVLFAIVGNVPRFVNTDPSPSIAMTFSFWHKAKPKPMEDAKPIVPNI